MDKEEAIERGKHVQGRLNGTWELQIIKIYCKDPKYKWLLTNGNFTLTEDNKGYYCKYRMDLSEDVEYDEPFSVSIKRFSVPMKAIFYKMNLIRNYQKELFKHINEITAKINNR